MRKFRGVLSTKPTAIAFRVTGDPIGRRSVALAVTIQLKNREPHAKLAKSAKKLKTLADYIAHQTVNVNLQSKNSVPPYALRPSRPLRETFDCIVTA